MSQDEKCILCGEPADADYFLPSNVKLCSECFSITAELVYDDSLPTTLTAADIRRLVLERRRRK